ARARMDARLGGCARRRRQGALPPLCPSRGAALRDPAVGTASSMQRVVITGLGTVNALGDTPERTFAACLARRSGVHRAPELAACGTVPLVATAAFDAERVVPQRRCAPLDRATAMALFVANEAIADSGEGLSTAVPETGVFWGTGMGAAQTIE